MASEHTPCNGTEAPTIGDQNVERLVSAAYQPDLADPEFIRSVQECLLATAKQLAHTRGQTPQAGHSAPGKGRPGRLNWRRVYAVAAALSGIALLWHAINGRPGDNSDHEDSRTNKVVSPWQAQFNGLTPRARPSAPAARLAAVGDSIQTKATQRQRRVLRDGSILYVNANTSLRIDSERRITLNKGEVFVEVAPRSPASADATFVVQTPKRNVAALGTKFSVRVAPAGTGVVVTQGQVKVSDFSSVVSAGQELVAGGAKARVGPAPRASHVLDWTRDLMAAAESPLVPASKHIGGHLIAVDPWGQEFQLSLRRFHVDVHIEDGFARTTIDQTYFNHNAWRTEGTFYFPLPPDASLSRLAMYVDGKLREGGMAERDHARNVFETIMYSQRDPALLEWVDGSTFKMRVFPLEGRQEKRILLSYSQRLPALYGTTRYRFPSGHSMEIVDYWSFHARIKNAAKLRCSSDSHKLHSRQDGTDLIVEARARNVKPDRDVTLELRDNGPGQMDASARFSTAVQNDKDGKAEAQYLMLRYRPQLTAAPKKQRRDWVFLFESSGDRNPLLARAQVEVVRTLLANAEHDDTFAIVTAGSRMATFLEKPLPATAGNLQAAIDFLDHTHLVGALALGAGLDHAVSLVKSAKNPYLVHVGSGIAILGERRADALVKRIPKRVHYVGVGVGKRWDRHFMKTAAQRTGGCVTQINPDEPITWRAFELIATLNTPRLMDVQVADKGGKATFLAHETTLAQGEELCAIARLSAEGKDMPKAVTISGTINGQPFQENVPATIAEDARRADYLPRTWAKLEIDRLLTEDSTKHKAKITELSKQMYVMSPFTSLLVLENDDMHKQYKIDMGRKDHWALYDCPKEIKVVYEPLDGEAALPQSVPKKAAPAKKPTVAQVLKTILVRVPPRFLVGDNQQQDPYAGKQFVSAHELYSQAFAVPVSGFRLRLKTHGREGSSTATGGADEDPMDNEDDNSSNSKRVEEKSVPGDLNPNDPIGIEAGTEDLLANIPAPSGFRSWPQMRGNGTSFGGGMMGMGGILNGKDPSVGIGGMMGIGGLGGIGGIGGVGGIGGLGGIGGIAGFAGIGGGMMGMGGFAGINAGLGGRLPGSAREGGLPLEEKATGYLSQFLRPWGVNQVTFSPDGRLLTTGDSDATIRLWRTFVDGTSNTLMFAGNSGASVRLWGNQPLDSPLGKDGWAMRGGSVSRRRQLGRLAFDLDWLMPVVMANGLPSILYQRPAFSGDQRLFTDLVAYAPGMNTSRSDIRAVLEAEAALSKRHRPGKIEAAAKELIDKARRAGWQAVTIPARSDQAAFEVFCDGAGRYVYERTVSENLRERVVCDGKNLWHLYPDLAIGAQRPVSRFHRSELNSLVPWSLPPASDLAYGADVKLVAPRTVGVIPHGTKSAGGQNGKPRAFLQLELIFALDGRLTERRVVAMPSTKVVYRETYGMNGVVGRGVGTEGKPRLEHKLTVRKANKPNLQPDLNKLVVVPMPLRSYDHLVGGVTDASFKKTPYRKMDAGSAIALIASDCFPYQKQVQGHTVFMDRFADETPLRLGFYTLLVANGQAHHSDLFLEKHAAEPLARYLAFLHWHINDRGEKEPAPLNGPADRFIHRLANFYNLYHHWIVRSPDKTAKEEEHARHLADAQRDLGFARKCRSPLFRYAVLDVIQRHCPGGDAAFHRASAAVYESLQADPGLAYVAGYESARHFAKAGQVGKARRLFKELFGQTLKQGVLPRMDTGIFRVFQRDAGGRRDWVHLLNDAAATLSVAKRRPAVIALAWQCHELGEVSLANQLYDRAFAGSSEKERTPLALAGIAYLWSTRQYVRAETLLQPILKNKDLANYSLLWRLGAFLASNRGKIARSIECMERALDLEYKHLPKVINLQEVRDDYGTLLSYYQQVVAANIMLEKELSREFLARVVRATDRWRSLDTDPTTACQTAAAIFKMAGARDLAWEYYTTPLSLRPNEAAAWLALAQTMKQEGEFDLAERSYAQAFEAEPTNAQILWDRALLLQQMGKNAEARRIFRQIATGNWQQRFEWLRQQAEQYGN